MARLAVTAAVAAAALVLGGCGGDGSQGGGSTQAVACDDDAFRAQDEGLYATKAVVANALTGGGAPAILVYDLRQAAKQLEKHLDAHPPCDPTLQEVAASERVALERIDEAAAAIDKGKSATAPLLAAHEQLRLAQATLSGTG